MTCPKCHSDKVRIDSVQENLGSTEFTRTRTKTHEARHGCLWWLFIGWWWWIIDLLLWIFMFLPRVLLHIGRRKKYVSKSTSSSHTVNHRTYQTICTCQNCGNTWEL